MGNRVRAVQDRRRSNAAGPHGCTPTRASQLADALDDWAADEWVCSCGRLRPPGETCAGCGR